MLLESAKLLSETRLLIVGDLMLDKYWNGSTQRISPEAPVPIVNINSISEHGGGAANVALNASSLAKSPILVGQIGSDESGLILKKILKEGKVISCIEELKNIKTITKLRVVSIGQQLVRVDFESDYASTDKSNLLESIEKNINKVNTIIISDYNKGTLSHVEKIISICNKHNKDIIIDPKGNDFSKYKNATIITPNYSEFSNIMGESSDNQSLVRKGHEMINDLNIKALIITRGSDGVSLIQKDHEAIHIPTRAKSIYDVTGAGDTFISVLGLGIGSKVSYKESVELANLAAGIAVGKKGTSLVTKSEIIDLVANLNNNSSYKYCTQKQLIEIIKHAKSINKKIVMTNGCFDILHPGHIHILTKARQFGDCLIVAINEDDSIRKLKGLERPINKLKDRIEMLCSLKIVDYVVSFKEETPDKLYKIITPDVLVKGGDYKAESVVGSDSVTENGGEVKIVELLQQYSSTGIIKKINSNSGINNLL